MKPTIRERMVIIKEMSRPENRTKIYDKLLKAYLSAWGARGKMYLEDRIKAYVKYGLSREEAILKVAKDEGYLRV